MGKCKTVRGQGAQASVQKASEIFMFSSLFCPLTAVPVTTGCGNLLAPRTTGRNGWLFFFDNGRQNETARVLGASEGLASAYRGPG